MRGAVVDVTDHPALDKAFDEAAAAYGKIDVCFANAGIDSGTVISKAGGARSATAWRRRHRELRGRALAAHHRHQSERRLRHLPRGGAPHAASKFGRIIVTTSLAALTQEAVIGIAYMAAKAGLAHFMRNMALELAAYNICVNAIAPGFFVTNIGGGHAHNPETQKTVSKRMPMHRVGWPEDMEGLALFLSSPACGYITGQQIVIDGGWGLGTAD